MSLQHSQNHVMPVECWSPNKGETAVHGCYCRGDIVVRMYPTMGVLFSLLGDSSRDGPLEKLWWGREGWRIHEKQETAYSGVSLACLKIRSRNEAINSTRKETDLLAKYFLLPILSTSIRFTCFWIDLVRMLATTGNTYAIAGYTRV